MATILSGCYPTLGSFRLKQKEFPALRLSACRLSYGTRSSWGSSSRGNPSLKLSAASGDHNKMFGSIPRCGPMLLPPPKASKKDIPTSFRYPPMTKKPKWWWRMLACLPYPMTLHQSIAYAETAYHLHPFLETLEFLATPFFRALGRIHVWFLMVYYLVVIVGIIKRKECPHFFRFHMLMGMLLEVALQVTGYVNSSMPPAVYWEKLGMHFWMAVSFAYFFTVLECIQCALCGM